LGSFMGAEKIVQAGARASGLYWTHFDREALTL
jgi:hypothetical protein